MTTVPAIAWSSVGKKIVTGVTGLGLFGFVVVHLLGNLTLFLGQEAFNSYAYFLEHLLHGWLIIAFEMGLIAFFAFHITAGVYVALIDKERARPVKYTRVRHARGTSRKTLSSRSMIVTGIVLGVFVVWHVNMFKFGEHGGYVHPNGTEMKDLYSLVVASFSELWITTAYVAVMILLGFHLRHGVWSAFQSLGLNSSRATGLVEGLGFALALVLAVGFLILPLYIYVFVEPEAGAALAGVR
jgi:succinate dehydrogenase / fumarate reductase cytochrome b subunit